MFALDIIQQLETYEVEYHVLQEEMSAVRRGQKGRRGIGLCLSDDTANHLTRLQIENEALRRQKMELLDQLQVILSILNCGLFVGYTFKNDVALHCDWQKFEACCLKFVALYQWLISLLYFQS